MASEKLASAYRHRTSDKDLDELPRQVIFGPLELHGEVTRISGTARARPRGPSGRIPGRG